MSDAWHNPPNWRSPSEPPPPFSRIAPRSGRVVRPSPVFLALVLIFIGAGGFVWSRGSTFSTPMRVGIFVFVATGWIISLCVHEFMHALLAYRGGDRSVVARGYLTLDPRRYMNRQLSIVLPIILVLIGAIGLPGGAVMIDRRLIPSRARRSMVAAAGPLTNLAFAVVCALPIEFHWVGVSGGHGDLAAALAFLALLETAVTIINALPIPGLDGFSVLMPYLPDETVRQLMPMSNYVFFGIFIVLLYSASAGNAFYNACFHLMADLGVKRDLAIIGQVYFTFWRAIPH